MYIFIIVQQSERPMKIQNLKIGYNSKFNHFFGLQDK